jgi:prepilin-type N-terminal cleavage/methylation domain-containing protein
MRPSAAFSKPRFRRGITLVELLVALFVLSIVVLLAGNGIVQALRVQSVSEATTSLQGKLRRITEVIAQDLRSSVLGAITDIPNPSTAGAVSFGLARGGQGYQVVSTSTGQIGVAAQETGFGELGLGGRRVLVVNRLGDAVSLVLPTTATADGNTWTFGHSCDVGMVAFDPPVRLFVIDAVRYNLDGDVLTREVAGGAAEPVAFDLSAFEVAYVYRVPGSPNVDVLVNGPSRDGVAPAPPLRVRPDGAVLESLRIQVTAERPTFGSQTTERSYVSQIAMPAAGIVNPRTVVNCP